MTRSRFTGFITFAIVLTGFLSSTPARADAVADFYEGKTVTVYNPFGEGGIYGVMVRLTAQYLPKYLPGGPNGVPQFMPGGGGLKQANYLYTIAPKDGTAIGLMYDNTPTAQVTRGSRGVRYDVRNFGVLGSINKGEFAVLATMRSTGIARFDEAKMKEAVLGSTGVGSAQYIVPSVINKVLGTKFKLVPGYKSTGEIWLAMERGELSGIFTNYTTIAEARPQWIEGKRLYWLAQLAERRAPGFEDVPLLQELADKPLDKEIFQFLMLSRIPGKIFIAPPGIPGERLAALQAAFLAMLRDPGFVAGAKKIRLKIDPRNPGDAAAVIRRTVETNAEVLERVNALTAKTR
jgi:tripartite-type tricarboxylate transporter receptor subunit TctC